jgi:hypothetical protein
MTTPAQQRAQRQNLRRGSTATRKPAKDHGRIQKALRRCFLALGPVVPADVLYSWARRWERSLRAGRSEACSGRQILWAANAEMRLAS